MLQKARNLRNQIREAKRLMKLKDADLMGWELEAQKPPRVILKTEEVERELAAVVERPNGIAGSPLDFQAMRQRVLAALADKPFDSTRNIPNSDPDCDVGAKKIENAAFTPEEIGAITKLLRGADVPAVRNVSLTVDAGESLGIAMANALPQATLDVVVDHLR